MPCSVQLLHYEHYEHWEQDRVRAPLQETQLRPAEEVTTLHCGQLAGDKRRNRGAAQTALLNSFFCKFANIS